ncbi:hypothetical protein ONS95_004867 [Cadophora gregata]|uniref:uncharacterized protein n=1 Tax=Cadophora gregata TaxID=51156 RepID=UPI0026DAC11E|nr:uncharacterized protein ONS95_004867 [Cadophora gregata]KAK0104581.1 hypothetical protein ONS95_004867 [Cadophora gregata]
MFRSMSSPDCGDGDPGLVQWCKQHEGTLKLELLFEALRILNGARGRKTNSTTTPLRRSTSHTDE